MAQRVARASALVREFLLIAVGSALVGASLSLFLVPNRISAGGVSGLATVVHHIAHMPTGISMLVMNIPLFILGVRYLGGMFGVRTLVGIVLSSLFTDLFSEVLGWQAMTDELLLASLYGGALLGVGLGIIFKTKGSTGGTDIIAQLLNKSTGMMPGQAFMMVDSIIISIAGLAFKSAELALWGFISLFVSTKIIDVIIEGRPYAKSVYIVSDRAEEIHQFVSEELDRTSTLLPAVGMHTGEQKPVLMCVVAKKQVYALRDAVHEIDPEAFMIISDVYEVLGKGFHPRSSVPVA